MSSLHLLCLLDTTITGALFQRLRHPLLPILSCVDRHPFVRASRPSRRIPFRQTRCSDAPYLNLQSVAIVRLQAILQVRRLIVRHPLRRQVVGVARLAVHG